jgi:hypothetical protein
MDDWDEVADGSLDPNDVAPSTEPWDEGVDDETGDEDWPDDEEDD